MRHRRLFLFGIVTMFCAVSFAKESPDIFVGPFSHWTNVKSAPYNATGNGTADDGPAIQSALTALASSNNPLYFPAGTYRITSSLLLSDCINKRIVGAHPDSVTIKWDGAQNGEMLVFSGVGSVRLGRITLDGNNKKAGKGIVVTIRNRTTNTKFPTGWEYHDMQFLNMTLGIQAGEGNNQPMAEASIIRCLFKNCSTGLNGSDFNTADIWFRFCIFEDCGIGVSGLAEGSVYNSIFRRSTTCDISDDYYMAARHCFSTGSVCFYRSLDGTDGKPGVLDDNTIIDPTGSRPIALSGAGPFVVFDNVVRSPATASAPVVSRGTNQQGNIFIGNTFTTGTTATAIQTPTTGTNGRVLDNIIVDRSTISATEPVLPSTPSRFTGTIYEPTAMTGAAIQTAILSAATNNPSSPSVVYLRIGTYAISSQIVIPRNVPVWIMGEAIGWGGATKLNWTGTSAGPVFKLLGPSRATFSDLQISGGNTLKAQIFKIENADQQEARVFMNRIVGAESVIGISCTVDRLDWTKVEGWDTYPGSQDGGLVSCYKVVGGPLTAAGDATTGCTNIWNAGGLMAEGGQGTSYFDITNNARLMATDFWGECGSANRQQLIKLTSTNSGTLTVQGYKMQYHTNAVGSTPSFTFNGFSGKATILGLSHSRPIISIAGSNPLQNVLFGANFFADYPEATSANIYTNTATAGQAAIINCLQNFVDNQPHDAAHYHYYTFNYPLGNPADAWLRDMMSQARSNHPTMDLDPTPAGTTDAKFYRIGITQTNNAMLISKCDTCTNPPIGVIPNSKGHKGSYTIKSMQTLLPGMRLVFPANAQRIKIMDLQGKLIFSSIIARKEDIQIVERHLKSLCRNRVLVMRIE